MLLRINPDNPEKRKIKQLTDVLEAGGLIIYPTDTVYGIGCDVYNQKAIERICRLRGLDPKKARLSIICKDISQVAKYTQQIDNEVFRLMRRLLPGPYTFVLKASHELPRIFKNKKKTVGIRVPDNRIILDLVEAFGRPVLTTSLKSEDEILEYFTDPIDIYEDFKKRVDVVVDGGPGGNVPSTVVDCTDLEFRVLRPGAGPVDWLD
ncbi:MAG: threonylcarbamoyl-AMP synthase [Bacteroidetes bacterium]|nr:MAG: threonylcarbamoyl-AMP synthase [Bacteroidota bacterium]